MENLDKCDKTFSIILTGKYCVAGLIAVQNVSDKAESVKQVLRHQFVLKHNIHP